MTSEIPTRRTVPTIYSPEQITEIVARVTAQPPLANSQVLDLVINGDPRDPEVVTQFYSPRVVVPSGDKPESLSPAQRIQKIIDEQWKGLNPDDQKILVKGLSKMFLGDYPKKLGIIQVAGRHPEHRAVERTIKPVFEVASNTKSSLDSAFDTRKLLDMALEITNGDVLEAGRLIVDGATMDGEIPLNKNMRGHFARLYQPSPDPLDTTLDKRRARLAFRLDVALGSMNPTSDGFESILHAFNNSRNIIKIEIMQLLAEQLLKENLPVKTYDFIRKFIQVQNSLYQAIKTGMPNSPFVEAYEQIDDFFQLQNCIDRAKDNRITFDDLTNLLETYPDLLVHVNIRTLQRMQARTRDSARIAEINALIKKKDQLEA